MPQPSLLINNLSAEKLRLLNEVTESLRTIPNVVAIVLGGSYASGMEHTDSDLDIGLYYRETAPFSVSQVRSVAEQISSNSKTPVVTGLYEWGPWVNGGAWIETPSGKVDFSYRNLDQLQAVLDEGRQGIWRHDYDQQPPYGFRSIVYFGETCCICVPLHDPNGEIARLKELVAEYPEALRQRIVQDSLWGAEFSLLFCRNFNAAADVTTAVGCMTRVAQFLIHALFALNKTYFVTDKSANRLIAHFALQPTNFNSRLATILAHPGGNVVELDRSLELLYALWLETVEQTAGTYNPRWPSARQKLA